MHQNSQHLLTSKLKRIFFPKANRGTNQVYSVTTYFQTHLGARMQNKHLPRGLFLFAYHLSLDECLPELQQQLGDSCCVTHSDPYVHQTTQ